ncbi:hypothetical protein J4731_00185 [Providencia rettgeri]|nr:hypothetical protein [Providencia rettgeri]
MANAMMMKLTKKQDRKPKKWHVRFRLGHHIIKLDSFSNRRRPVSVWRELRRMGDDVEASTGLDVEFAEVHKAADTSNWSEYTKLWCLCSSR